jgi:hypothetical protein
MHAMFAVHVCFPGGHPHMPPGAGHFCPLIIEQSESLQHVPSGMHCMFALHPC